MSEKRDLKDMLVRLRKSGFDVALSKGSHYKIRYDGEIVAFSGSTPSKNSALRNLRSEIRRWCRAHEVESPL